MRCLVFILFIACSTFSFGQNLLKEGDDCFDKGDYECASVKYNRYLENNSGNEAAMEKKERADNCATLLLVADDAFGKKDFVEAKGIYKDILLLNPNDPYAKKQIGECDRSLHPPLRDHERLKITKVTFANTDKKGKEIDAFGSVLYNNTLYLMPKIYYNNLATEKKKITLLCKVINPDGTLKTGTESPKGYSYSCDISLQGNKMLNQSVSLTGWGNEEGTSYKKTGIYKWEIWCEGMKLYSTSTNITEKTSLKTISPDNKRSTKEISIKINKIWTEHNLYVNNQKGMKIHVDFNTENMLNIKGYCAAYFYFENDEALKDINNKYNSADGKVALGEEFKPIYISSRFSNFVLFLPYEELHLGKGKFSLKFSVNLYEYSTGSPKSVVRSEYQRFTIDK